MKKSIKNIIGVSVALLGFGACQKKLDLFPYNAIETSQSFKSVKDATTWNNGLYSDMRGRVYGSFDISQEVQAEYLNAALDYGNRNGNPHRWGTSFLADDGALSTAWQGYYFALRNVNAEIAGFETIPATTPADIATMNKYKGDAYLARAWYYSQLIVRFAKPYEPATASTDLGVPLVLTYDLNALPPRSTIKQVYDQILADIAQAKTLLSATSGAQGSVKFTKDAAAALEARVRLYMQDWAGAMAAAQAVINTGIYPLITTATELSSYWTNDLPKETIMQIAVVKTTELANTNSIYLGYRAADGKYDPDFIPTQTILNTYAAADSRKSVYFKALPVIVAGIDYPGLTLVNKYPGNPALFTAATTNYQHAPKVFRIAEMYLIYAEAAQRAGGANEALALTTLNQLKVARGLTPFVGTGGALQQEIRDERTRELAFEGFHLWDLKRWHLGFTRGTPQNLGPVVNTTNFLGLVIAADDPKFVWGIPTNDAGINKNLVQNTGW